MAINPNADMNQNLKNLMQEAQKMQQRMQEAQDELKKMRVAGKAGGNKIIITMSGDHTVHSIHIDPSLQDHFEMLGDLITAAFNDAVRKVEEESKKQISKLTSTLNLPTDFMKEDEDKE